MIRGLHPRLCYFAFTRLFLVFAFKFPTPRRGCWIDWQKDWKPTKGGLQRLSDNQDSRRLIKPWNLKAFLWFLFIPKSFSPLHLPTLHYKSTHKWWKIYDFIRKTVKLFVNLKYSHYLCKRRNFTITGFLIISGLRRERSVNLRHYPML